MEKLNKNNYNEWLYYFDNLLASKKLNGLKEKDYANLNDLTEEEKVNEASAKSLAFVMLDANDQRLVTGSSTIKELLSRLEVKYAKLNSKYLVLQELEHLKWFNSATAEDFINKLDTFEARLNSNGKVEETMLIHKLISEMPAYLNAEKREIEYKLTNESLSYQEVKDRVLYAFNKYFYSRFEQKKTDFSFATSKVSTVSTAPIFGISDAKFTLVGDQKQSNDKTTDSKIVPISDDSKTNATIKPSVPKFNFMSASNLISTTSSLVSNASTSSVTTNSTSNNKDIFSASKNLSTKNSFLK